MSQSDEFQARLRTLEELRAAGVDPYPPRAHPTHTAAQVRALLQEREGDHVTVAGRIVGGLRPMPEKFHGLEDTEARYRQRYLDLLVNEEARRVFLLRSRLIGYMRRFLDARGFVEVETPILQPLYGGGAARPFVTHFNVLDEDLYLRIALELYLKRLIIGGFDRVYEIGHNFRNEGFSRQHSPEYTMLEAYQAYADYADMMELCETMIEGAARELLGTTRLTVAGREVDLAAPWPRVPLLDAITEYSGVDVRAHPSQGELFAAAARAGVELPSATPRAKIIDELLKTFVEPRLIAPTHLIDYPVELSPLAKRKPGTEDLVERFESFVGGIGIGVDRVTMVFTGATNIRDVILFPHLRRDER